MFDVGKKATCRSCGKEIELCREEFGPRSWEPPGTVRYGSYFWRHTDLERGEAKTAFDDLGVHCDTELRINAPGAEPAEWCWWFMESGHRCLKGIKDENRLGGFYACGRHMPQFVQQKERQERNREYTEKREADSAMEKWEKEIYNEAMASLHGFNAELFPIPTVKERWHSFDREVQIDIVELERWLRELTAYAPGGGLETPEPDDDSVRGVFEELTGEG